MAQLIKIFSDNSTLEFDTGKFDDWCVYLTRPSKNKYAPTDIEYFTFLSGLTAADKQSVYNDFISIYNSTFKTLEQNVLNNITTLCAKYGKNSIDLDIWLTTIYTGMIAEENKTYTRLGKRIKRLGLHQVLLGNLSPVDAANFSRGKKWKEIDIECNKYGF